MTATISDGATSVTAVMQIGYQAQREGRSVVHPILGSTNPAVTLRPAALRVGEIELLFDDDDAAAAAVELLTAGNLVTLTSAERSEIFDMTFVPQRVKHELNHSRRTWTVRVEYHEVAV